MAGISTEQGGEKLNTELNLVPFIDLLSTLVLFLLVTAVWVQISVIPASVESKGRATTTSTPTDRLSIRLTSHGYELTWPATLGGRHPASLPKAGGNYDLERLILLLQSVSKSGHVSTVAVSADDVVPYGSLIETIDRAKEGGIPSVALSTE